MHSRPNGALVLVAIFLVFGAAGLWAQTVVEPPVATPVSPATGAQTPPPTTPSSPSVTAPSAALRIGAGDLIEVSVYGVPDFRQDTRVSDQGQISLPLVGSVGVGGMTIDEAQKEIAGALVKGGYFRDPNVTVLVKEFASQGISVMGEVARPGVYPVMGTRRLFDVISIAGGLSDKAGQLVIITHRDKPAEPQKVAIGRDLATSVESNVPVFPGDTILVSQAAIVYVVGDVMRPGGFAMRDSGQMTVLQAVAMALGLNRSAAVNRSRVIRRANGKTEEIDVPLKDIMSAKKPDMVLMADDILFVPMSTAKNAARRGVDMAIAIATHAAIY